MRRSLSRASNRSLVRSIAAFGLVALMSGAAVGLVVAVPAASLFAQDADPAAELVKKLKEEGDRAKPELIKDLANLKTRAAFDGLKQVYDVMKTTFMKREVVRVLHVFDNSPEAEQPALQMLMDIATSAQEAELREAALDGLGMCPNHGKDFLRMIVVSGAEDSVREKAIKAHVKMATKDDLAWYRELYTIDEKAEKERAEERKKAEAGAKKEKKEKDKKGKGKDKDGKEEKEEPKEEVPVLQRKGAILNTIRLTAFEAISSTLKIEELEKANKDPYPKIHRAALEEMALRGDKKTFEFAENIFKDDGGLPENRVVAARVMAKIQGTKVADDFIKRATNNTSPIELRRGLAEILVGFNDENVNKQLIGELGRGKNVGEKLFSIYSVRGLKDERVDKALVRMLQDKEKAVIIAAIKILGERKYKEAAPQLKKMWDKGAKDREIMRAAMDATAMIRQGDPAWLDELIVMTKSEDPEVRSLALDGLGNSADPKHIAQLVAALDDKNWSTRLAALEALERLKVKEAISPIILRMQKEEGRMANEFANTLWRLTGQPYADNPQAWDNWWKENGANFQILSDADLEKVKSGEEEWRLRQTTRVESKFFGIRIISHRVIFIVDVSGSMDWDLANDYRGKPAENRMEVAKTELSKCIQALDSGALFNIISFSSDVEKWIDGHLAAANDKNRTDAVAFVDKLKPFGATNIYGALQAAFADPDVDTIFFLSDGEPTAGDETDAMVIREHVKGWNEHRKIVINTIAIAGQFQILEWLAEDSGGTHVKFE
jgi:HEAT repeat protein